VLGALNGQASNHWAYAAPHKASVPKVAGTDDAAIIDRFVRARLVKQGIRPSPAAGRRVLIRRVYLDLLGLPPTPSAVEAFVADRREDAYGRLVDHLLASPHFGERWGRHWLDLARYADSDGYEKDTVRPHAWRFRDWVISAIHKDMPFDRFIVEQLAGDLLPDANESTRIATGFHRNTLTNKEGGVDQEEYRCKAVVDRVNTTSSVFLGLTVGCAQCHDHKFDPIKQREYFQMFAFFDNADERDITVAPPAMQLAAHKKAIRAHFEKAEGLRGRLAKQRVGIEDRLAQWERARRVGRGEWHVLEPTRMSSSGGATFTRRPDGSILASGKNAPRDTYKFAMSAPAAGVTGFRLEILTDKSLRNGGPSRSATHGNFVLNELVVTVKGKKMPLGGALATWSQSRWHVRGAIDGNAKSGWAIAPHYRSQTAFFSTGKPLRIDKGTQIEFALHQDYGSNHTIGRLRLSARTGAMPKLVLPSRIEQLLSIKASERSAKQKNRLSDWFATIDPKTTKLKAQLAKHDAAAPRSPAGRAMAFAERRNNRRTTEDVGWTREITLPGLPQIRTCGTTASGSSNHGLAAER
jgi:Protein of unknown function (DUF1549)